VWEEIAMLTTCWAICWLAELTLARLDPIRSKYYTDLQLMQGEWELVTMEPEFQKELFKGMRLTVKGNTMISRFGRGTSKREIEFRFILRPQLSPKGIDSFDPGQRDSPPGVAIYEVTEHLLIILDHAKVGEGRPKDFSFPDPDDNDYYFYCLMVFRRVK
jgi:uncharacterized protein (TIGR03067 family)